MVRLRLNCINKKKLNVEVTILSVGSTYIRQVVMQQHLIFHATPLKHVASLINYYSLKWLRYWMTEILDGVRIVSVERVSM